MIRALLLAGGTLALLGPSAAAQDTLHVERLQEAALRNDPRVAQRALLKAATDLRLDVIGSDRLPRLTVNGQASHQSDVTEPKSEIPGLAKLGRGAGQRGHVRSHHLARNNMIEQDVHELLFVFW